MNTKFDEIYDLFFKRVINDPDFFGYKNVPDADVIELMETNAFDYMIESISTIYEYCTPEVDFNDYDLNILEFNFEMSKTELQILVNIMFEKYLSRDYAKLKIYNAYFTTNEVNMFSPAQERKTFVDMLEKIKMKNVSALKSYASRDRITNALVSFNTNNL